MSRAQLAKAMRVTPNSVEAWETTGRLSFPRIQRLAAKTRSPLGDLFLGEPIDDALPLPDFRAKDDLPSKPSQDLLETVFLMRSRQAWMRDELVSQGFEPLPFVGSCTLDHTPRNLAAQMRGILDLNEDWACGLPSWDRAQSHLRDCMEAAGILVVLNGVVGNNSRRKLDPREFQGFCLSDSVAPLIFINAADFRTAQVFSLAHELAHVFLAQSGISKLHDFAAAHSKLETLCDSAAAEFLVPEASLLGFWNQPNGTKSVDQAAGHFKVSSLVIGRRLLDLALIPHGQFLAILEASRKAAQNNPRGNRQGGSFWATQQNRIGRRFGSTVARAVKQGELQYTDGYFLTGLTSKTFEEMMDKFGVRL